MHWPAYIGSSPLAYQAIKKKKQKECFYLENAGTLTTAAMTGSFVYTLNTVVPKPQLDFQDSEEHHLLKYAKKKLQNSTAFQFVLTVDFVLLKMPANTEKISNVTVGIG